MIRYMDGKRDHYAEKMKQVDTRTENALRAFKLVP